MNDSSYIVLPPDGLLVFLDETGHERMPSGHTVYGIGGCAVMMRDYESLVIRPWRAFRQKVTGSPDEALHAYEFGGTATVDHLEAMGRVFQENPFMRIGAAAAITTQMPDDISYKRVMTNISEDEHLAWMVLRALPARIIDVAKWTDFNSIAIIFEANPRSKHLRASAFSNIQFQVDWAALPTSFYEMDKTAREPGLEIADFIANTVGGHARSAIAEARPGFRKDFRAVFHSVGPKLASYMGITAVDYTPSSEQPA